MGDKDFCDNCNPEYTIENSENGGKPTANCVPDCDIHLENCSQCSDSYTCTICEKGYQLDDHNTCETKCEVDHCLECRDSPNTCSKCDDFYDLESGNCKADCSAKLNHCQSCSDIDTCTKCYDN